MRNSGKSGLDFEKDIEATFDGYAKGHIARMGRMPVPTRIVGTRNGQPILGYAGRPPFDVYGFLVADGRMIGAELKKSQRQPRLPLVHPTSRGDGVLFHQIDALAALAQAGGIARIVWNNGGEVGVLTNAEIITALDIFEHALKSQGSGKDVPRGSKSIAWERFQAVDYTNLWGTVGIDWLLADK